MSRLRSFVSNVLAIAYKESVRLRREPIVLHNVVFQPFTMLMVFGYALSFTPQHTPWAVLDRSESAASRQLVRDIEASGYFAPPVLVSSYAAGHELLASGDAVALVVVPQDLRREIELGQPTVQVLLDGTDPLTAARIGKYIAEIAQRFTLHQPLADRARAAGDPSNAEAPRPPLDLRQQFRFNPTLRDLNFYLAGLAGYLLTNICLGAASLGLVAEKENGTYEQLLAQPTGPLEVVLGKLLPHVVIGYVSLGVATLGAWVLYDFWPEGSLLLLAITSLPFILATLTLGVFVSAISHTSAQAVFLTIFFIMPSFVLSGSMLPYQLMPHGVREIGGLLPLRWYQILSRRIIERGATASEVAVPTLVLCGLFAVLLVAVRWRMKPRLG